MNVNLDALTQDQLNELMKKIQEKTKKHKKLTKKQLLAEKLRNLPPRKVGTFIERSTLPLKPHQKLFVESFIKSMTRGALAIHGVGTGKSLTAVATAEAYLAQKPDNRVLVVAPASLVESFKIELYRYDPAIQNDNRYEFYTIDGFTKSKTKNARNALVIIDEAQNLRTEIKMSKPYINSEGEAVESQAIRGKKAFAVLNEAIKADKVMLLSATPIVNRPLDIENLMAIINGHVPLAPKMVNKIFNSPELMARYFGCRLSYFQPSQHDKDTYYPKVRELFHFIPMDKETEKIYKQVNDGALEDIDLIKQFKVEEGDQARKLQAFHSGQRKASNALGGSHSQKINYAMDFIRAVVHQKPNEKLEISQHTLDTHTDKIVIFTHFLDDGSKLLTKRLKQDGIEFGEINGKVSKAKRAKIVSDYVAGKIKVIFISKAGAEGLNLLETGYLMIIDQSWNETEIEQVKGRAVRFKSHFGLPASKQNVLIVQLFLVFPNEYENRKKYIEAEHSWLISNRPYSADLILYTMAHEKQHQIISFMKKLYENAETLENCTKDKEFLDLASLFEEKATIKLPPYTEFEKELQKLDYGEELPPHRDDAEKLQEVNKMMVRNNRKLFSDKEFVQLHNAFFTPPKIAKELVKFSGITEVKYPVRVLEPTAGAGYLCFPALKENKNVHFDVCEFIPQLKPILDEFPRTRFLQRDFLTLPLSHTYHYIVMNPPFSIKTADGSIVKDIHFVKKALNHLKPDGVLVALISNSWTFNTRSPYPAFRELINKYEHYVIKYESGFQSLETTKAQHTAVRMTMLKIIKKSGELRSIASAEEKKSPPKLPPKKAKAKPPPLPPKKELQMPQRFTIQWGDNPPYAKSRAFEIIKLNKLKPPKEFKEVEKKFYDLIRKEQTPQKLLELMGVKEKIAEYKPLEYEDIKKEFEALPEQEQTVQRMLEMQGVQKRRR